MQEFKSYVHLNASFLWKSYFVKNYYHINGADQKSKAERNPIMSNDLIKKTRTKKELKKYYAMQRSRVGLSKNLSTKEMESPREYNRKREKRRFRDEIKKFT